jgi:hypothetical protein
LHTLALFDFRFVCRKNETPLSHPEQEVRTAHAEDAVDVHIDVQKQQAKRPRQPVDEPDCGKPPAYPQDWMCKKPVFWAKGFFVQHQCSIDTMLFQPLRDRVNR